MFQDGGRQLHCDYRRSAGHLQPFVDLLDLTGVESNVHPLLIGRLHDRHVTDAAGTVSSILLMPVSMCLTNKVEGWAPVAFVAWEGRIATGVKYSCSNTSRPTNMSCNVRLVSNTRWHAAEHDYTNAGKETTCATSLPQKSNEQASWVPSLLAGEQKQQFRDVEHDAGHGRWRLANSTR
jgi:hypothetical protein